MERGSGPFVTIVFDDDSPVPKIFWGTQDPEVTPSAAFEVSLDGLGVPGMGVTATSDTPIVRIIRSSEVWDIRVNDSGALEIIGDPDGTPAAVLTLGVSRPSVTGSRAGNAALTSLLSALDGLNLIDDNTTA